MSPAQNVPIYMRTASAGSASGGSTGSSSSELRLRQLVHAAVDVLEEKLAASAASRAPGVAGGAGDLRDPFIGLLCPSEDFRH